MGATVHVGSDCYAVTIVEVSPSGKTLTIQYDRAVLTKRSRAALAENWGAPQTHLFIPDTEAPIKKVRLLKTGRYRVVGYGSTGTVTIGVRCTYRDPSR
jgi:hypothetical protein